MGKLAFLHPHQDVTQSTPDMNKTSSILKAAIANRYTSLTRAACLGFYVKSATNHAPSNNLLIVSSRV